MSKLSIIVPTGQIQLQKTFPKRKITSKARRTAIIVGTIRRNSTFPVTRDCIPPSGQASHSPSPTLHQPFNHTLQGDCARGKKRNGWRFCRKILFTGA
ncbi:MAG: hypothetical protein ACQXXG_00555 [Candidatus Bathyarchaeia archaeon]